MNDALSELYQDVILDHGKRPRNYGPLDRPTAVASGFNPLCGDQLTVFVKVQDGKLAGLSFEGTGCAIFRASASLMTSALKELSREEAEALFEKVHLLLIKGPQEVEVEALGKLAALSGVFEFPARVKCASLPWHTLKAALSGALEAVSTE